ncbi:glycosyltransferase family 2 protein [Leptothermofonsia sp. ETS-13]|uniref:glycosyltransferase family 2 protein n=1 Tax=Leptothermofonsia sp. ETS-13 TaxID=3035696 RepID=UPI003B9FE9AD
MALLLGVTSLTIALVLLIPTTVLFVECVAAVLVRQQVGKKLNPRPSIAVLIPAHNEASGIGITLASLKPQMAPEDRLVVIADNCDDGTAAIACEMGANVIERFDQERRGKGYALDFGLKALEANPPEVVIVVDADCTVELGSIEKIARQAITYTRPVQAIYLMTRPAVLGSKDAVSLLAFTVKNWVRPVGLDCLGFPCLLTGTGMAFPWTVLQKVSLASGNIVEDMKLGLDLAMAGHPPMVCSEARVTGVLPQQARAAKSQRTRWEHGHLQTLLTQIPRLITAAVQTRCFDLVAIALDLSVPPLSLLVILWLTATILALIAGWLGSTSIPIFIAVLEGIWILTAILLSWARFARQDLPLRTLLSVPLYVLWKIPLYFAFLVKPQTQWVRTERDTVESPIVGDR